MAETKEKSLEQLKAQAYDMLAQLQELQQRLMQVNKRIAMTSNKKEAKKE